MSLSPYGFIMAFDKRMDSFSVISLLAAAMFLLRSPSVMRITCQKQAKFTLHMYNSSTTETTTELKNLVSVSRVLNPYF